MNPVIAIFYILMITSAIILAITPPEKPSVAKVEKITEIDGCKVYRLNDNNNKHYFEVCRWNIQFKNLVMLCE